MTIIIFIIVLAVLIFVHELGHFIVARACGIRVDAFALGFGPKLVSWKFPSKKVIKNGETEYSIRLIPFGGYVKIFGEDLNDETINGPDANRSFVHKPKWQQALVLAAGIIFNFIFAFILYISAFSLGVTASTDAFTQYNQYSGNPRIMITDLTEKDPAYVAGLRQWDVIKDVSVDGMTGSDIQSIQDTIQKSQGHPILVDYIHDGKALSVEVTPTTTVVQGKYAIGIEYGGVVDVRLPFFLAIKEGASYTWGMMENTVIGLATFVATIFRGTADFAQVSGPVGIAGFVGSAASFGFSSLLLITALISINLGVINLVPFPALDGGRILFVIIEAIFRRRISSKVANVLNTVGFVLLMGLMVLVTYNDVAKIVRNFFMH